MTTEARIRREKQKIGRSGSKRAVESNGEAAILAFFLDRGLVVHRVVCFAWRSASSGGLRHDTAAGIVERCQSDIHSKMFAPCFPLQMWEWLSFSLAEDRGLSTSRSRFNRHSPGFNQHSPGFVCSVLRIADAGMAFSDRGLSPSRFNRPSPGFNRHLPVSFAPCFGSQIREWLSL